MVLNRLLLSFLGSLEALELRLNLALWVSPLFITFITLNRHKESQSSHWQILYLFSCDSIMNLLSIEGGPVPVQKLPPPVAQFLQSITIDIKVNSRNTRTGSYWWQWSYQGIILFVSLPMILYFLVDSLVRSYSLQWPDIHSMQMGILQW